MNCLDLKDSTTWPCQVAKGVHGESVIVLAPPVAFWDGSVVPVYVVDRGEQIEITDDGGVLEHLDVSGFAVSGDRRRRRGLEKAVAGWDVSLTDELQLWCKPGELRFGLQRFLGALFAVARWESENAGKLADSELLIAEAEMYLRALDPAASVAHDVELHGISGRQQSFPLRLGETFYEAVGAHHASSASVVKKLVDVRLDRHNKDIPITVIIEDRVNRDRAKADIQIFSQLAHVTRFSDLQSRAMQAGASH
jgi:hypothetical protein